MGALCVQTNYVVAKEKTPRQKSRELQNSYMGQLIKTYTDFYGRPVTKQIQDFIQNNYESSYYLTTKKDGVNQTGITTCRSQTVDILKNAHKNGQKTYSVQYEKAQEQSGSSWYGSLWYNWNVSTKSGMVRYRCQAEFNYNKKLFRQTITRLLNTDIPKYIMQQPKKNIDFSSSNNLSYQRPPERFDGDAWVRQQNADFRDRMNKQAQQWNNYAIQKNNRGW